MIGRTRVSLTIAFSTLLFVAGGIGFATAQDEENDEELSDVSVERRANLSPQEQLDEANRMATRGEGLSRRVSTMLDEARQERDIIRVTCLNDKLAQINANLRSLQRRTGNLSDAVAASDPDRGGHEFTVITVLDQKLTVLDREASQCIGEDIFETGATTVTTEIEDNTPSNSPEALPVPPVALPVPVVPPPASGRR